MHSTRLISKISSFPNVSHLNVIYVLYCTHLALVFNGYAQALRCPPMNRLFEVPRSAALTELAVKYPPETPKVQIVLNVLLYLFIIVYLGYQGAESRRGGPTQADARVGRCSANQDASGDRQCVKISL